MLTRTQTSRMRSFVAGKVANAKSAQKPATRQPALAHIEIRYFMVPLLTYHHSLRPLPRMPERASTAVLYRLPQCLQAIIPAHGPSRLLRLTIWRDLATSAPGWRTDFH